MPFFANSYLAIKLENPGLNKTYRPGDTIIGTVFRTQQAVSPRARIWVWLCGITEGRTTVIRNNSIYRCGSQFPVLNGFPSHQLIHDGPLHIAAGGERMSWPFTITIPTRVSLELAEIQMLSYLPLDPQAVSRQTLPSSMAILGDEADAHIEYWVEARLQIGGHGDARGNFKAQTPFNLRNYHSYPLVVDFGQRMIHHSQTQHISSQYLIPGMEQTELSFRDKMKKFYRASSIPKFYFQIEIGCPSIIQLDPPNSTHPTKPFDVMMRVTPVWTTTSQILQGVQPIAKLTTFRLTLKSISTARAFDRGKPCTSRATKEVNLMTPSTLAAFRAASISFDCTANSPFVNIGELINLHIGYYGPPGHRLSPSPEVYPCMETYNIRHKHELAWEVGITIGKETVMAHGSSRVRILDSVDPRQIQEPHTAPATPIGSNDDSWIQPPPEDDVPPPF